MPDSPTTILLIPPAIPAEGKHIVFDPTTQDYVLYVDGRLVGSARTEQEAEAILDEMIAEIARHTQIETADMAAEAAALREELGEYWWEI